MNLNIFKRIDDLEEKVSYLFKQLGSQIDRANVLSDEFSKLRQTKQTDADKIAKRRAYARAYYAKNKGKK